MTVKPRRPFLMTGCAAAALFIAACGGAGAPSVQTATPSASQSAVPVAGTDDPGKTYPMASGSPSDYYGY